MELIDIILKIISALSPFVLAGLGFLFNFKLKKMDIKRKQENAENEKNHDKKLLDRDKKLQGLIMDRLEGIELKVVNSENKFDDLNKLLKSHMEENDFRSKFKDAIQDSSRQVMSLTHDFLDQDYKNMLAHWADTMKKFGLDFYYSNKRKDTKKNREKWINEELKVHIGNFYNFVNFHKSSVRTYQRKKVLFSDFVKKIDIHGKTEILKIDLIRNGFKHYQDVIDRFTEYMDDFINDFINCVVIWNRQELVIDKHISA